MQHSDISVLTKSAIPPDLRKDNSLRGCERQSKPGRETMSLWSSFVSSKQRMSWSMKKSVKSGYLVLLLRPQTLSVANFKVFGRPYSPCAS